MVKHTQTIYLFLPKNCLSVFDHFVGLMPKGLWEKTLPPSKSSIISPHDGFTLWSKNKIIKDGKNSTDWHVSKINMKNVICLFQKKKRYTFYKKVLSSYAKVKQYLKHLKIWYFQEKDYIFHIIARGNVWHVTRTQPKIGPVKCKKKVKK